MPGDQTRMTRRRFLAATGVLSVTSWLARCTDAAPPEGSEAGALPPRVVGLRTQGGNFRFDPVGIRIEPGETLRWLNMGDFHTSTAFHPDHSDMIEGEVPLRIPRGADPWHSGTLGLDDTRFERRFDVPGVYDYFCQPHYRFGMVARLVVDRPVGGPGSRPAADLPSNVRETLPPVDRITGPAGRGFEWASRLNGILFLLADDAPRAEVVRAARAVRSAVAGDQDLRDHLRSSAIDRVLAAVDRVAEGVESGAGYEELVTRADEAKDLLVGERDGSGS